MKFGFSFGISLPAFALFAASASLPLPAAAGEGDSEIKVDFVRDVRPVFREHCYECHGPDEQKSGLRLDIRSAAMRGGSGHAPNIVPGNAEKSSLLELVEGPADAELKMPPKGARLPAEKTGILRRWIEQGAVWPDGVDQAEEVDRADHWSFHPVQRPEVPGSGLGSEPDRGESSAWGRNEIDAFILRRLEKAGLAPSPPADPATWLRRLSLDLTGLPPTAEELERFLSDPSGAVRATVVDRLLDSPRHGERWAQHWLDVVRYADTSGYEVNRERPNAWPYRDYVIEALNADRPYDRFVREQIAGDALGENRATGFLVTSAVLLPGQIGKDEASKRLARQDELTEIVTNTGEAFLGLSIGCARCHDHKFDALSAEDFYAMQAFFSGVHFGERPDSDPETEKERQRLLSRIAEREATLRELSPLAGVSEGAGKGGPRPPVNAVRNIDRFDPVPATRVRFVIDATCRDDFREPFLDELEIYDTEGNNIALAERGVSAKDSGNRGNSLAKLHDGLHGNDHAWRGDSKGQGWVQLEFTNETKIAAVVWSRDRLGRFNDRLAVDYRIEVTGADGETRVVASAKDRAPSGDGKPAPPQPPDLPADSLARWNQAWTELRPLHREAEELASGAMIYAGRFTRPEPISLLRRGDPEQPVFSVSPATPAALGERVALAEEAPEQQRRLALSDWIASPENPLTARVIANRIWQGHFGTGLVDTPNDFGRAGAEPTHPELLDWLASELVRSGWSLKHLHRLIALSATYGQSARIRSDAASADAGVRLLWRYPARRLEAEAIRDSILHVSGRLDPETGGPGFDLYKQRGGLSGFAPVTESSDANRRRMIYAHKIRMETGAVFGAFDCPDGGQSMPRRGISTTPVQALNLFNSPFTGQESAAFAERMEATAASSGASGTGTGSGTKTETADRVEAALRQAWKLAYARPPQPEELAEAAALVRAHGWSTLGRALFNSNEFVILP